MYAFAHYIDTPTWYLQVNAETLHLLWFLLWSMYISFTIFFFILFNINEWIHHATRQYEKPKGNAEPKVKLFWTKTLKKEVLPGPSKRLAEEQQRRNLWSNIIRLPSHTLFVHFCRVSGRAALLRSKTQKYPADISADENDCTATVQGNQQSI